MVNEYLQNTDVAIVVNSERNSTKAAERYDIPVPAVISANMTVAVRPPANSEDKFWLCIVTELKSHEPLSYNIRYYNYNKAKKGWILMKGPGAYSWVRHNVIIAAGIEFNANRSLKANSIRLITKKLQED